MTSTPNTPIRPTDDEARGLAHALIQAARFASLGVLDPETNAPKVTRIALVPGPDGVPMSLISTLSEHTRALMANPLCSLLIGEPGGKSDPLTHPRLTLQAKATHVEKSTLRDHYLNLYPKARLYYDFADFQLVHFEPVSGFLNGGFGKAFNLDATDVVAKRTQPLPHAR